MRQSFIAVLAATTPSLIGDSSTTKTLLAQLLFSLADYGMPTERATALYDTYAPSFDYAANLDACLRWSSSQPICYIDLSSDYYSTQISSTEGATTHVHSELAENCYLNFIYQLAAHPAITPHTSEDANTLLCDCIDLMKSSILWVKHQRQQSGLAATTMNLFADLHCEQGKCSTMVDLSDDPNSIDGNGRGYTVISEQLNYAP